MQSIYILLAPRGDEQKSSVWIFIGVDTIIVSFLVTLDSRTARPSDLILILEEEEEDILKWKQVYIFFDCVQ